MKRRVVKHGPATYIVSLPSNWVKKYDIKKGDEIDIEENGNTLVINSKSVTKEFSIKKDMSGLPPRYVDRFLARAYQKGYDKINIIHNDLELLDAIKNKIPELMGYEVMEQNDKTCLIVSISNRLNIDFENSLRRAFLIVKEMIKETKGFYIENKSLELGNIYLKDLEVNRMCYFCLRQINKKEYINKEDTREYHILYYLIEVLEDLGDSIKSLANYLINILSNEENMVNLINLLYDEYSNAYNFFYNPTKEKANKGYELHKQLSKELGESLLKYVKDEKSLLCVYKISEASNIISHYISMRLDSLTD